jgi:hypothetical protein
MKDITFWVGAGVGFVSAVLGVLLGAWVQFKFRIKEHEYKREQERVDREKEERAREEAESKRLVELIGDRRNDIRFSDEWKRVIEEHRERRHSQGFYGSSALDQYYEVYKFNDERLRDLPLHELKILYMVITNIHNLMAASELFYERERRLERAMSDMSVTLKYIQDSLSQSDKEKPRKE